MRSFLHQDAPTALRIDMNTFASGNQFVDDVVKNAARVLLRLREKPSVDGICDPGRNPAIAKVI